LALRDVTEPEAVVIAPPQQRPLAQTPVSVPRQNLNLLRKPLRC